MNYFVSTEAYSAEDVLRTPLQSAASAASHDDGERLYTTSHAVVTSPSMRPGTADLRARATRRHDDQ